MFEMDNKMAHLFVKRGKIFPLGQALPIHISHITSQNGRRDSRKEAYVY